MTDVSPDYPSIASQPGSEQRNIQPLIDALEPILRRRLIGLPEGSPSPNASSYSGGVIDKAPERPCVLEIASGSGEHLKGFAEAFQEYDWVGSERELHDSGLTAVYHAAQAAGTANILRPMKLDILDPRDWRAVSKWASDSDDSGQTKDAELDILLPFGHALSRYLALSADKRFRCIIVSELDWDNQLCLDRSFKAKDTLQDNLLHCAPFPAVLDAIFSNLRGSHSDDRRNQSLIEAGGRVTIYGAFMNDDGTFASENDQKFHERFISISPYFGLRKVRDISDIAARYGWELEDRKAMMSGNWMLVYRLAGTLAEE